MEEDSLWHWIISFKYGDIRASTIEFSTPSVDKKSSLGCRDFHINFSNIELV